MIKKVKFREIDLFSWRSKINNFKKCIRNSYMYQNTLRYIWIKISLLNNMRFYNRNKKLFYDKDKSIQFQKKQIVRVLKYAQEHVPYYKNMLANVAINSDNCMSILHEMPVLTKDMIRKMGSSIYSNEIDINDMQLLWGATGGSTGEPLRFPKKSSKIPFEFVLQYFLLHECMKWCKNENIVSIDGQIPSEDKISQGIYYNVQNNFPYGRYHFSSLHLHKDTLDYYIDSISKFKPSILRGYPSSIANLARLMDKRNIHFDFSIKGIYITSEVMTSEDERYIRKVFKAPIFGQYGNCETSIFAISPDGSTKYFASPIYGFTEILNQETNEHVELGETGEIVVTGFVNNALPFIRYKTGDLGVDEGLSEKGELIIGQFQGRTVDYIVNKNGDKIFLTGFIFGSHMESFANIYEWELEQTVPGEVLMRIIPDISWKNTDEIALKEMFNAKLIDIEIEYTKQILKSKRSKRIFMIQNCK